MLESVHLSWIPRWRFARGRATPRAWSATRSSAESCCGRWVGDFDAPLYEDRGGGAVRCGRASRTAAGSARLHHRPLAPRRSGAGAAAGPTTAWPRPTRDATGTIRRRHDLQTSSRSAWPVATTCRFVAQFSQRCSNCPGPATGAECRTTVRPEIGGIPAKTWTLAASLATQYIRGDAPLAGTQGVRAQEPARFAWRYDACCPRGRGANTEPCAMTLTIPQGDFRSTAVGGFPASPLRVRYLPWVGPATPPMR